MRTPAARLPRSLPICASCSAATRWLCSSSTMPRRGAGNVRAGQALRGSSEFHAWGDSNLYLRREGDTLTLSVEHSAAAALKPMKIALVEAGEALALQIVERNDDPAPAATSLDERITAALVAATSPLPF